jgi:hypothetical protein
VSLSVDGQRRSAERQKKKRIESPSNSGAFDNQQRLAKETDDHHSIRGRKSHLLGAILAYVPEGQAMLRSVLTMARPPLGTTVLSAAERSNPAEWGEPRDGIVARSLRNLTRRHSSSPLSGIIVVVIVVVADIVAVLEVVVGE